MAHFNLEEYQTVQERVDLFRQTYPDGRFEMHIVHLSDQQVIMKASVYTLFDSTLPTCVDYAEERVGTTPVNKVSHVENCATSALGRAISQLGGVFSPKGKRPSREEMEKVVRNQNKDWLTLAKDSKDIDALRLVYAEAASARASQDVLAKIKEIADERSSTGSEHQGATGSLRGDAKKGADK